MKVVIETQVRENYGAHIWDGDEDSPVPAYWKCKGGHTYVVENLSEHAASRAVAEGCPTLTGLISHADDYFEESVIAVYAANDDAVIVDEWETPVVLTYTGAGWVAKTTAVNDGVFRKGIAKKVTTWTMGKDDAKVLYEMVDGRTLTHKQLEAELELA